MSQYVNKLELPIKQLYEEVAKNMNNPSAAFYGSLDALEAVTNGDITLVDPTNPTVFLLESASVAAAASFTESINLLRKLYPNLAETPSDLYHHMTDYDYANRFATPCQEKIGILLGLDSLMRNMIRDDAEKCVKAIIPRDTEVRVGNLWFTFMYPVVIRYYDTGSLSVSYDVEFPSSFQLLETNIIPYDVRSMPDGTKFLYFQTPLLQVKIDAVTGTIQAGRMFKMTMDFTDQFFYCRAFLRGSSTGNHWVEIKTTHTDMVYDLREPTVVLQVEEGRLTAFLPQVYTVGGKLLGEIMLLNYTTKGDIVESLENYETEITLRAFNTDRDLTDYTTVAMVDVPRIAFSTATTTGGKNGLSFEELRKRVIFNSTGTLQLPITNTQIEAVVDRKGFELIKNVDLTTNRIFLATQKLPKPTNAKLITTANIAVETLIVEHQELESNTNVYANGERWTISPKCLFKQINGRLSLLTYNELQALRTLPSAQFMNHVNSTRYLYTPFHWVLDNSNQEFGVRPYYLDNPKASTINFVRQNETLELAVNTSNRLIEKTTYGYKLSLTMFSGNHFKALSDTQVFAQLRLELEEEVYFLNGYISDTINGERVFAFDLDSNFDIDKDNRILIKNFLTKNGESQDVFVNLEQEFSIFICTTSKTIDYKEDDSVALIAPGLADERMVPITHEKVTVTFGYFLKNLWSRARSLPSGNEYQTHEHDQMAFYEEDVYEEDPITGRIFTVVGGKPVFKLLHAKGDPVLDNKGEHVVKFRKGDVVVDPLTGQPSVKPSYVNSKEADITVIDGKHYFVDDPAFVAYNQEMVNIILSWVTEDLVEIENKLLEQTEIFFHPRGQLGDCSVDVGGGTIVTIDSEQSPVLDLYVPKSVFRDNSVKTQIQNTAISILDELLTSREISNSHIESVLSEAFGDTVTSLRLHGLGPNNDIFYARVVSENRQLALKRVLAQQPDGTYVIKENVTFNFYSTEE